MLQKELRVAMLEDDSDDRYLTEEVLNESGFDIKIEFYSRSHDLFAALATRKPNLILIDFNSAPENGVQVLQRLKESTELRHLPVIILSDSNVPKYREQCYAAGAATYAIKPKSLVETRQKISAFFSYWIEVAEC
ncbi:MAG TPA: response regulator [Flavisolibacter sp.]|nr:response regulator [Flavisolibacter sp.]